ncbi:hypothetical protein Oweho_0185 [Owenweeksia hongkongensis DSM 17368]|uniref:DUF2520 domain-containing protein n=1 Tax=Owenweeksia hongkongensis (strain DSM 17368 / CIP 108786 / JCM 12287 / NRRL B-23963 / UST20020801) TaxID=926562 RepID=G8R6R4_OWEHD|nr:DUF2520 domain-containing protein [Owenweeksia hongkongensis]AEV31207.1 hypothetical protein Oweho_0185 [Owenweeksia hongkongensis DSM 17368]
MKIIHKIGIIGTGNVGSYLHSVFVAHGFAAKLFGRKLNPHALEEVYQNSGEFDLILLCVNDEAIAEVSSQIEPSNTIVAHVSGATPLSAIAKKHTNRGVFYPLMSLKGHSEIDASTIPFCLEANNETTLDALKKVIDFMGAKWNLVNSEERTHLHLAAVLAHNFSNHLHYQAQEVMNNAGLDFRILLPLLENALQSLQHTSAKDMQTGPAIRHDESTINRHLDLLQDNTTIDIYKLLTKSIQDTYDKKL